MKGIVTYDVNYDSKTENSAVTLSVKMFLQALYRIYGDSVIFAIAQWLKDHKEYDK